MVYCLFKLLKMKKRDVLTIFVLVSNMLLILFITKTTLDTTCFNSTQLFIAYFLLFSALVDSILASLSR